MRRRLFPTAALVVAALAVPAIVRGDVGIGPGGDQPGTAESFALVGHNPLFNRGMNAAPAIYFNRRTGARFAYVGNRTDG